MTRKTCAKHPLRLRHDSELDAGSTRRANSIRTFLRTLSPPMSACRGVLHSAACSRKTSFSSLAVPGHGQLGDGRLPRSFRRPQGRRDTRFRPRRRSRSRAAVSGRDPARANACASHAASCRRWPDSVVMQELTSGIPRTPCRSPRARRHKTHQRPHNRRFAAKTSRRVRVVFPRRPNACHPAELGQERVAGQRE